MVEKAPALAAVFPLEPQVQPLAGLPVQPGADQMAGSVGQGSSLVDAAALFALGVGVVGRERPGRQKLPEGGQLITIGGGIVGVDGEAAGLVAGRAVVVYA